MASCLSARRSNRTGRQELSARRDYAMCRPRSRISPCSSMRCRLPAATRSIEEKASGAQRERPELKAALDYMREGDTLVVWKLDRLARSLKQLIETVEKFGERGIGLRSLTEAIDTTTAGGKLVFHIFAALAEFERGVIRERTLAGLQAARARGRTGGRPPALEAKDLAAAKALLQDPEITVAEVARRLGVAALDPLPPSAAGAHRGPGGLAASPPCRSSPSSRYFYPIDWPQISHWVRFVRAKGCCQACGRPHGADGAPPGRRPLVGRGAADLARRQRPQGPLACPGRGRAGPDDQGRAGGSASRPRPRALRAAAPQRQSALPAVPSAPRPARASAADPADPAPAAGPGRSVLRPLSGL